MLLKMVTSGEFSGTSQSRSLCQHRSWVSASEDGDVPWSGILATNMKNFLDTFMRHIGVSLNFPFPDEKNRAEIWTV
jgi:hypothetical protein